MGLPDSSCLLTKSLTLYNLFHPFCCNLAHCPQIRDLMPNLLPPQPSQPSTSPLCALELHMEPWSWHLISSLEGAAYLKGGYNGSVNQWLLSKGTNSFFLQATVWQCCNMFHHHSCFSIALTFLFYFYLCSIILYIYIYLILHPFMLFVALDVFLLPC